MYKPEQRFMEAAINEAHKSQKLGDYAVGAVLVKGGEIIAAAGNRTRLDGVATAHAEKLAIEEGSKKLGERHLIDCVLYATHEPCPLCTGASYFAKLQGIVFGASVEDMASYADQFRNEQWVWRTIRISSSELLDYADSRRPFVMAGFMREECLKLFHH